MSPLKMDRFSMMLWTTLVACVILHIPTIQCGGAVEVYLNSFKNAGGKVADNDGCCDALFSLNFLCAGACDYVFIVCLDDRNGPSSTSSCEYGSIQTGEIADTNTINTFNSSIGGTDNPMVFSFSKWPGSMKLKVRVEDFDFLKTNDFISFHQTFIEQTPSRSRSTAGEKNVTLNNRTSLSLTFKVYCDLAYYGDCSVFCQPKDDYRGHYTCHNKTGEKLCTAGWTGQDCDSSVDDCIDNGCRNGGTCIDGHMSYTCRCPERYTGSRCGQDLQACSVSPCKNNGICTNFTSSISCTCPVQWTGLHCTEEVDFCEKNLCQNSACVALETTYSCSCNSGWTGQYCDVDIDECQNNPCNNNATCVDNAGSFTCMCIEGFHGRFCETNKDECSSLPCMNNGTCTDLINDFQCQCSCGFTGTLCENDVDECTSSPCKHGSMCENHDGGFNCRCVNGTVGDLCEENINECESYGCQNGGTCMDGIGMFECACADEFTG
ncbi:delta-like protein D [Ruditapes philippinarum]|uniref:delta-like protein D n=1 Tax=Ruditapes philippinarum TaxID=129788 RepID=UPI00295B0938|nr:delta-like protein D [Ruditapes philippinarum]